MTRGVRGISVGAIFAMVLVTALGSSSSSAQQLTDATAVPHELLVKFRPQASKARRGALLAAHGARVIRHFETLDIHHLRLPEGMSVDAALRAFLLDPEVSSAQPNYLRYAVAAAPPNDPYWLDDTLWGLRKIQAQAVWSQFTTGDSNLVVADIDTGANYNHPDLVANMWHNLGEIPDNGIDDDGNGYIDDVYGIDAVNHDSDPMDDYGHGTHTAGTIAAAGNNGVGVVGVAWNVKVIACKFIDARGRGSDTGAIQCFDYIMALKQRGINVRLSNNSWGGARGSVFPQTLKDAIDAAGAAGILNVFAAGNAGVNIDITPFDPASFTSPSIVAVAASDQGDHRAGFSNYGVTSVDLAAPGVDIISTYFGDYTFISGTSMSSPHVAGAAALLLSLNPALSASAVKDLLINNVDVIPEWSGQVASSGRLNVLRAATLPAVELTGLVNGATYASPATLTVGADASDCDGTVSFVTFYSNGSSIGTNTSSPYSMGWSSTVAGSYTLTAVATDNSGARAASSPVTITVSDTAPTDSDADGISDSWELLFFGNLNVATPTSDFDGDGVSDLNEYRSGTNPKDSSSVFRVNGTAHDSGGFHLTLRTVLGYQYQLERSGDLASWVPLGTLLPGTGTTREFTDASATPGGKAFYRVVSSPPPP